ncbi:MAG TPA: hypothetical protein VN851_27660 [Thermoanaerobaculia bacterium]|nr:hypothetical protein [Thermoanaerobaculia bacterium]
MSRSKLLPLFLFAVVLVFVAAHPASAASTAPAAAPAVAAPACGVDAGGLFATGAGTSAPQCGLAASAVQVGVPEPEFLARLGYCHCGCSTARCHTSADCGGSSCDATISCC